ncbi:branched-chain amino acid aminotransferase [Luteibacter sp. Sphag1AF]|uniref:branched-chain amino acid transaminase n=1 Tax=Luteibacter sp. Sphag1AF TaxID=2587031 RepID=UPI0016144D82|nr:branched-chain amino acid transaminase [Luteibacter sp. Sphag1AF]MBB3227991.1 branched-chain amino acid aminotransferase [Luteibacter sp. Sphag1AF]
MQAPTHLWHNGRIKAWHEATVHVGAHALHYGSSVFEGVRVYATPDGPRYFRLEEHTTRLFNSARVYDLTIPFDADAINQACREVIAANGLASAYVRPIVYRSGFTFSLAPPLDTPVDVAIIALPWGAYHGADAIEKGVDVCVSSWNRAAPNTFPSGAKAGGNYLNSQLIAREAANGGYAEGIALGTDGLLSEGAGENLFVVHRGKLYTPPSAASILCGITRDSVLTLAAERGIEVVEQPLPREMLYFADEVFMTGTAAEVTAVRSVDRKPVGTGQPGPVTRQIQADFFGLFNGRTEDKWGWLSPIDTVADAGRAAA